MTEMMRPLDDDAIDTSCVNGDCVFLPPGARVRAPLVRRQEWQEMCQSAGTDFPAIAARCVMIGDHRVT